MADIRLTRPAGSRIWLWTGILAFLGLALWGSALVFGDATDPDEQPRVGAALDLGAERPPVLPALPVPLETLDPIGNRDLGRLVQVTGVAETSARDGAMWMRTTDGRRILVRFEPEPEPELMQRMGAGSSLSLDGYLAKISRAEFEVWMDSLGVRIPRPPPARKFGDLPDPDFARINSLFIKNFYLSVRPEALRREEQPETSS